MSVVQDKPRRKQSLALTVPANTDLLNGAAGEETARSMGMVKFSAGRLKELTDLGIEIEQAGSVRTDRGSAFLTRDAVLDCVAQFKKRIADAELDDLCEISGAMLKLSKSIQLLSEKNMGGDSAPAQKQAPRRAFVAGQNAQFHVHNHVHHEKPNDEKI